MISSFHTITELHQRIAFLWENKQYGTYTLGTLQNHTLTLNQDNTITLIHDNALFENNFNPNNNINSLLKFLTIFLPPCVYNPNIID